MCSHEKKICERCGTAFECRVGNIVSCQCYAVKLTEKESQYIAGRYTDCLCAGCMQQLKQEYHLLQQELQIKVFLRGR